jgi:hypothetical protein
MVLDEFKIWNCDENFEAICRIQISGFGDLGVACWPLVPMFVGSNPAETVGFLRAKKSSAHLPSEGSKAIGLMS